MCLRDDNNKYSNNAIKVLSNVEKKKKKGCTAKPVELIVGHVPGALAKILHQMMKEWRILSMKAVINGEGTWVPG